MVSGVRYVLPLCPQRENTGMRAKQRSGQVSTLEAGTMTAMAS